GFSIASFAPEFATALAVKVAGPPLSNAPREAGGGGASGGTARGAPGRPSRRAPVAWRWRRARRRRAAVVVAMLGGGGTCRLLREEARHLQTDEEVFAADHLRDAGPHLGGERVAARRRAPGGEGVRKANGHLRRPLRPGAQVREPGDGIGEVLPHVGDAGILPVHRQVELGEG